MTDRTSTMIPVTQTPTPKEAAMVVTKSFRSFDGSTVHVLEDGRAVRDGITGQMLLTSVGGQFVRYLDEAEQVAK